MTIRTISELKSAEKINKNDLFKISHQLYNDGDKYSSQKISYQQIEESIVSASVTAVHDKWNMNESNVDDIDNRVSAFEDAMDIRYKNSIDSVVHFKNSPQSNGHAREDTDIPNVSEVVDLIRDNSDYITPGSYINVDTQNANGYGSTYVDNVSQYHWHIDAGNTDSSKTVDKFQNTGPNNGVIIKETGILTIYGWIASNSEIAAQEAWVGLFGNVKVKSEDGKIKSTWQALQIQPFIVGKYSQVAQYVGFTIPVRSQLELKIMTGFKVNDTASGLHVGNSLMFNNEGNMPNTFVGYVLQNSREY